jgi:serine protease Do
MKYTVAALLLLALCLSSAGCYIEFSTTPLTTTSQAPVSIAQVTPLDPNWRAPKPAINAPALPNIADVVEKGYPAVVAITTEQLVLDMFSRTYTQSGAGSGWVLDNKGIIVTNNHVVEGANKLVLQFADGSTLAASSNRVFRDPLTDLAIIKIDSPSITALPIGDSSKLRVGEWVVGIGNPLGKGLRAKEGTISGLKVSLSVDEDDALYDLIETSTAINPGNSGGPLLNMKGEVIGITSAKISAIGVECMGYAISISSAMPIIEELITKGYVTRPFLGVELVTVNKYIAYANNLSVDHGAIITVVQPGSPAANAGLKRYDVVTRFHNTDVSNAPELLHALRSSQIGDQVNITYVRGKNTFNTTAQLSKSPPPRQ